MSLDTLIAVLSLLAAILSITSFAFASLTYIELKAQKNSTHTIQYVPVDQLPDGTKDPLQGFQDISDGTRQVLTKDPFEAL